MITPDPNKRYKIGDVAEMLNVPIYLLRQWEENFPQLRPKRDRANRRYYTVKEIEVAKRIKHLIRHDRMTHKGAQIRLSQELHGEGRPKTNSEVVELLDKIDVEVRAMQDIFNELHGRYPIE